MSVKLNVETYAYSKIQCKLYTLYGGLLYKDAFTL